MMDVPKFYDLSVPEIQKEGKKTLLRLIERWKSKSDSDGSNDDEILNAATLLLLILKETVVLKRALDVLKKFSDHLKKIENAGRDEGIESDVSKYAFCVLALKHARDPKGEEKYRRDVEAMYSAGIGPRLTSEEESALEEIVKRDRKNYVSSLKAKAEKLRDEGSIEEAKKFETRASRMENIETTKKEDEKTANELISSENIPEILETDYEKREFKIRDHVSSQRLKEMLHGKRLNGTELLVVDCRYPYEYDEGHIVNAMSVPTLEDLGMFFEPDHLERYGRGKATLVFHCEFSSRRGPLCKNELRRMDRELNASEGRIEPTDLYYPNIYLLRSDGKNDVSEGYPGTGGYRDFYNTFGGDYCVPRNYVAQKDFPASNKMYTKIYESHKVLRGLGERKQQQSLSEPTEKVIGRRQQKKKVISRISKETENKTALFKKRSFSDRLEEAEKDSEDENEENEEDEEKEFELSSLSKEKKTKSEPSFSDLDRGREKEREREFALSKRNRERDRMQKRREEKIAKKRSPKKQPRNLQIVEAGKEVEDVPARSVKRPKTTFKTLDFTNFDDDDDEKDEF